MKPASFDTAQLKAAFGTFPSGVTVISTRKAGDAPSGFTASSFTSVSLNPALVLFCIDKGSDNIDTYRVTESFAVNILADDQQQISNRFASDTDNRFEGIDWSWSELGNPLIAGAVSQLDCTVQQVVDAGDHLIVVGEVKSLATSDRNSLGYYRGRYQNG